MRSLHAVGALLVCCSCSTLLFTASSPPRGLSVPSLSPCPRVGYGGLLEVRGGATGKGQQSDSSKGAKSAASSKKRPVVEVEDEEEEEDPVEDEEEEDDEYDGDDDDEDEEEEDEEEEDEEQRRPRAGAQPKRASDWHYGRRKKRSARPTYLGSVMGLAKGMAKLTGKSVTGVADMIQPNKKVSQREVVGVWKMKQKIKTADGVERCEATIEIRKNGQVATFYGGKELLSEYVFKERAWPRACVIEFEAKAFKGPYDREPVSKFYKGYFKRNLVNSKIVRLEGRIFESQGKLFWRQKTKVGSFKAVRVSKRA